MSAASPQPPALTLAEFLDQLSRRAHILFEQFRADPATTRERQTQEVWEDQFVTWVEAQPEDTLP